MQTTAGSPSKRAAIATGGGTVAKPMPQPMRAALPATPLDYSFMGLATLSDMILNDPVCGRKKPSVSATVSAVIGADSSSLSAASPSKLLPSAESLRVNNNKLRSLDDMDDALSAVFEDPTKLQWIDLSGNALTSISASSFANYPEILTLHLHGNQLSKYTDIDHLADCLPKLHALTLHGNPLDEKKHYRSYVIASFPLLKQLDFSSVTKGDRQKAETWATIYKKAIQNSRTKNGKHRAESAYE